MRRPRRARLIDPTVAHLDGAGLAGLMPYAQKAALIAAIGTAGPLIDRCSKLPDVPKEHRDAYVKSVLEQTLSPWNLLYAPLAAATKMAAGANDCFVRQCRRQGHWCRWSTADPEESIRAGLCRGDLIKIYHM